MTVGAEALIEPNEYRLWNMFLSGTFSEKTSRTPGPQDSDVSLDNDLKGQGWITRTHMSVPISASAPF